jgi:hypothetical protein
MARIAATLSIALAALALTPATGAAVDPQMICPDMFVVFPGGIAPPGTDKNANGIVCTKPADGMIIWRDDLLMTA